MFRRIALAAGLLVATALAGTANAASYSCYGNLSSTERAVCSNAELSQLDSRMANLYFHDLNWTINQYGPHHRYTNQFRSGQIYWLSARNGCSGNFNCLWTMYMNRIQELQGITGQ